jgi:hypothetical protein
MRKKARTQAYSVMCWASRRFLLLYRRRICGAGIGGEVDALRESGRCDYEPHCAGPHQPLQGESDGLRQVTVVDDKSFSEEVGVFALIAQMFPNQFDASIDIALKPCTDGESILLVCGLGDFRRNLTHFRSVLPKGSANLFGQRTPS